MSFIFLLVELFCNVLWKWLRVCLVGLFKGLLGLLTSKKSKILKPCIWLSFPKELSKKQTWKLFSRRSSHHPTSRWNWACILLQDAHDDDGDFAGMNRKSGGDFFFFLCVWLTFLPCVSILLLPFCCNPFFLSSCLKRGVSYLFLAKMLVVFFISHVIVAYVVLWFSWEYSSSSFRDSPRRGDWDFHESTQTNIF